MRRLRYSTFLLFTLLFINNLSAQLQEAETATFGDRLSIGMLADKPIELNPFQVDTPLQGEIIQLIFGYGLAKRPDKYANPPDLIARYFPEPSRKKPTVWRMMLDRNINFHNGINLRNADVIFTFELIRKYGGHILNRPLATENIKSVSGRGDLEIIFELYKPDPDFGQKISSIPIISKSYYQEALQDGYEVFQIKKPLGMGPFVFDFRTENKLVLKYHPHYYTGRPFLDQVTIHFFNDEQALMDALVNGEVDYIELPDRHNTTRLHELLGKKLTVFTIPRPERKLFTLLFNVNTPPLSDPVVRQAISRAINRKSIIDKFMSGIGKSAATLIPSTNHYYERSIFDKDRYSPKEALQLLKKAGWELNRQTKVLEKNGRPLSFSVYFRRNSDLEINIARAIKIDLSEIHIDVQPAPVEGRDKDRFLNRSAYQSMIYAYSYDEQYLYQAFHEFFFQVLGASQSQPNYRNRYLSRLFRLARNKSSYHTSIYQRFQSFVHKENPALFLFFDERILIGVNSRFRQVRTTFRRGNRLYYRLNPIENWYVPKGIQK